jgi:ribonuclease HII
MISVPENLDRSVWKHRKDRHQTNDAIKRMKTQKSISEIKSEFDQYAPDQLHEFCERYTADGRSGVQALIKRAHKMMDAHKRELDRIETMRVYENRFLQKYDVICGVDEAGRGPLAGPVVAGAVILPKDCHMLYLNDSKKLSAKKRDELYEQIKDEAISWAVGIVGPERIDEINILQATYEAMRIAIGQLTPTPQILLNDAVEIPRVSIPQCPIIKGDAKSISIAAASIMAKVTRDRIMMEYDNLYPAYGFASHKGYGSAAHIEAIRTNGPSPIHRNTFIKNFI